jgi:ubiquinone/menaquinone biosynthesis C-methylase UbiE
LSLYGRVFAAVYDAYFFPMERGGLGGMRARLLADADGKTLEIGAGTGLNLERYPRDGVTLTLAEPEEPMAKRLQHRVDANWPGTQVLAAPAEALPFASGAFDTVVSTLVLCTVPDQPRALTEIRRVLRPGGQLLFLEHVRSENPRLARWQDRLHRPWYQFAYGCNCNVPTLDAIKAAEFEIERIEVGIIPRALPIMRPMILGRARTAAAQ